jgi:proteasome lid subunit RPN8/RPN11
MHHKNVIGTLHTIPQCTHYFSQCDIIYSSKVLLDSALCIILDRKFSKLHNAFMLYVITRAGIWWVRDFI